MLSVFQSPYHERALLHLSRDGAAVLATETLNDAIAALTSDGTSFLAITSRDRQLYAIEVPPLGPRRRIARVR